MGMSYPRILGHEGAGYVVSVGPNTTIAKPGDAVLLSYDYCGTCASCSEKPGKGTYCDEFTLRNTIGVGNKFALESGEQVAGKYFGQSSFAKYSIVEEKSVVNVTGSVDEEEMKVLAPLGCGLMTGSGAIVNVAKPGKKDGVLVTGIGAVGFGAIMAAKIQGVETIVALDRVKGRLDVAKELGATHVVDTSGVGLGHVAANIKEVVGDADLRYCVETTGVPGIIEQAVKSLGPKGRVLGIGIPPLDGNVTLSLGDLFFQGKSYEQNILGDSISREALPMMIKWWRDGKFPVENLVKFFKVEDAEIALKGMEDGSAIKPVLVW